MYTQHHRPSNGKLYFVLNHAPSPSKPDASALDRASYASQLGFCGDFADYVDSLGSSHTSRLQSLRHNLNRTILVCLHLDDAFRHHQKLLCLLIGLLHSTSMVDLCVRTPNGRVKDGVWRSSLLKSLLFLKVRSLDIAAGVPCELATAFLSPSLRRLIARGSLPGVDWQRLKGCILDDIHIIRPDVDECQAILNYIATPLRTLHLEHIPYGPCASLLVPPQAVDRRTVVTLSDCSLPTTFPTDSVLTCSIQQAQRCPRQPLFNIPTSLLTYHINSSGCPSAMAFAHAVLLSSNGGQPPQGEIYPMVQAVRTKISLIDDLAAIKQLKALENGRAWFRAFPNASVLLVDFKFVTFHKTQRPSSRLLLLLNPVNPLDVRQYGSLVRLHGGAELKADMNFVPLLELVIALDILGQRVPDTVYDYIFRALLVAQHDTLEHAMANTAGYYEVSTDGSLDLDPKADLGFQSEA
jgi:hypothetical protein